MDDLEDLPGVGSEHKPLLLIRKSPHFYAIDQVKLWGPGLSFKPLSINDVWGSAPHLNKVHKAIRTVPKRLPFLKKKNTPEKKQLQPRESRKCYVVPIG